MAPCEKWMLAEHGWNVRPPTHGKERPVHLVEPWGIVKGISLLSGYNQTVKAVKATKPASCTCNCTSNSIRVCCQRNQLFCLSALFINLSLRLAKK